MLLLGVRITKLGLGQAMVGNKSHTSGSVTTFAADVVMHTRSILWVRLTTDQWTLKGHDDVMLSSINWRLFQHTSLIFWFVEGKPF